jgi:hypothetical protein
LQHGDLPESQRIELFVELPGRMLSLTTIAVKATLMLAIEIAG